jgi:hypothetical protein
MKYETEAQKRIAKKLMMVRGAYQNMKRHDDCVNGLIPFDDYVKECELLNKESHQRFINKWLHTYPDTKTVLTNPNPARQWFLKNFDDTIDKLIADVEFLVSVHSFRMINEKIIKDALIYSSGSYHGDTKMRTVITIKALPYQNGFQINIGGLDDNDVPYGLILPYKTLPKNTNELIDDLCILNYPHLVSNQSFGTDINPNQLFLHHAKDVKIDLELLPVSITTNLIKSKNKL